MFLKDLLVATQDLVLAVTCHLVECNFVLILVFFYANHGLDDGQGLLIEAFHHFQLIKEHEVAVKAAVFLQLLVLEHGNQMQFHQLHDFIAVEAGGILAEEDVVFQKVFIIKVIIAIFGQTLHLFDE